jgi:hypothetical protein
MNDGRRMILTLRDGASHKATDLPRMRINHKPHPEEASARCTEAVSKGEAGHMCHA